MSVLRHVQINPPAMRPGVEMSFEEWNSGLQELLSIHARLPWEVGDWADYMRAKYDTRYSELAEISGISVDELRARVRVAKAFPASRRRPVLGWELHSRVAGLSPDEQDRWLDQAEREGWGEMGLHNAMGRERRSRANESRRLCAGCGEPFTPTRADARYHSGGACRQRAFRRRQKAEAEQNVTGFGGAPG